MKKEKYKAQSLAIAMVVLVVSSILAISVYSRVSKDKALSLDERASAEALEVSDLILNYLTSTPIKDVIAQAAEISGTQTLNDTQGITLTQNASTGDINTLLTNLGLTTNLNSLSICPLDISNNTYYLNIRKADLDSFFEVRPGQIMALPIKGIELGEDCNSTIKAAVRGDNGAGFSLTYVYAKGYVNNLATEYKPYDETDVINYCFAASGSCNNSNFLDNNSDGSNWVYFKDDNSQEITIDLNATKDGYRLDEIKISAIGGTVGISYVIPTSCTEELNMINVQVGANCSSTYRGKSVLIPEKQWETPIFNYVLFNGEGSL